MVQKSSLAWCLPWGPRHSCPVPTVHVKYPPPGTITCTYGFSKPVTVTWEEESCFLSSFSSCSAQWLAGARESKIFVKWIIQWMDRWATYADQGLSSLRNPFDHGLQVGEHQNLSIVKLVWWSQHPINSWSTELCFLWGAISIPSPVGIVMQRRC